MEFTLDVIDELTEAEGNRLLALMSKVLEDNGLTVNYAVFEEMFIDHPIGDSSTVEEVFFQSKITRKLPVRKGGDCSSGSCPIGD